MENAIVRGLMNPITFEREPEIYESMINPIEFPCPCSGNSITPDFCFNCHKSKCCDIYIIMIDEYYNK